MVDVASPATMPSESEVHVARNFLTKILRSSMRRNRFKGKHVSGSRPHSWHSSKLTEEETSGKSSPGPVWQLKHDSRPIAPASAESLLQRQSLSSAKAMEGLDFSSSPGKKFSSDGPSITQDISCSTNPPSAAHIHEAPFRKGTSAENIFFKGLHQERGRFLGNGGWEGTQDQPMSRLSIGGRTNIAPVWQIPEKKKSQSPPPPPPPLRSDSFAATKVFPFSDVPQKMHNRSVEHLLDNNLKNQQEKSELRRSLNPINKDFLHPSSAADPSYKQPHPNKLFSLSSIDVRHFGPQPIHQRQYSDESPLYLNTRTVPSAKSQSVGSYYRSLQDLPANIRKNQRSATLNSTAVQNVGKFYQPAKEHKSHRLSGNESALTVGFKAKALYNLPPERNGQSQKDVKESDLKKQLEGKRQTDPWVPQEDHRITAQKTPLLHSLAQENRSLASLANQETSELTASGKISRRSDRYATTLRNEIQQKRAQLQKSRSAATLSCDVDEAEEEEEAEDWKRTGMSNTYKDHLKEAQARVLQATSFQRRDLEPTSNVKLSGRVRGRKRLPLAKRTHSFSEPDKMDKVGVEEGHPGESFERKKFTETRPAFAKPIAKSGAGQSGELEGVEVEKERLGTFAEYQATWSKHKKDGKTQGRFHSAENILDAEETNVCVHERSRSSPSADFYSTNNSSPWIDLPVQQSSQSREEPETVETVVRPPDHSPDPPPAVPRPECPSLDAHRSTNPGAPTVLAAETTRCDETTRPEPEEDAALLVSAESDLAAPQICPVRITDRPPAVCAEGSPRSEGDSAVLGLNPVRKVPVTIVHSESGPERCPLPQISAPSLGISGCFAPSTSNAPSVSSGSGPSVSSVSSTSTAPSVSSGSGPSVSSVSSASSAPSVPSVSTVSAPSVSVSSSSAFTVVPKTHSPQQNSKISHVTGPDPPAPPSLCPSDPHAAEDLKRAELARDIMDKDRSLAEVLDPSGRRTTMDLMEGLYPEEEAVLGGAAQRRRPSSSRAPASPRTIDRRQEDCGGLSASACLVPSSSYYNTSAPKAELLIKMKDMGQELEQDSEDELDPDLASKKLELIWSLARKLEVLREARQSLQEDVEQNEALGRDVEGAVQRSCLSNQLERFRMFVGDLDKVVSLLLSLSGRLARVENALNSLEEDAPANEKLTLTEKRRLLMRQHEDAKELKENLDRREGLVSVVMETHLSPGSLDDYRHFVKMKSALIIEQRRLEDKIKLGEEQLKCLLDSLPLDQRPLL